jgi:hypothetical protein
VKHTDKIEPPRIQRTGWVVAYWALLAGWVLAAVLNMARARGGFLTNYMADLANPPWLYIGFRGLQSSEGRSRFLLQWFGRTPERTAISIFLVGAAAEVSQRYWPKGIFAGTYDPWDILAYAVGLGVCYGCERWQTHISQTKKKESSAQ